MGDFHAFGCFRQVADVAIINGNIENLVLALDEEMVVIRYVGIEIGAGTLDSQNADQASFGKLMQRVINRGERNRHAGGDRLIVQFLDRQVAITLCEKKIAQSHTLTRGAQPRAPQPRSDIQSGVKCHAIPFQAQG